MNIESEAENIQSFVDKGNYHAAYNIALSGLNACRRNNDQWLSQAEVYQFRKCVPALATEFGSH